MTKHKAAKERKRAKRKQAERARGQERKSENRRAAKLIAEGLDQGTARGLAAIWSVPKEVYTDPSAITSRPVRVPAPQFYANIRKKLDRSWATRYIAQFVDSIADMHAFSGEDYVEAAAFVCREHEDELAEPRPMPAQLLFMAPMPEKWLERELVANDAEVVVWVIARQAAAAVIALDKHGNLALWFVDDEGEWHAASQAKQYLLEGSELGSKHAPKCHLRDLLEACGAAAGPHGVRASPDDPAAVRAVEAYSQSSDQMLKAFFHMVDRHEESNETLDVVAAENERLSSLERQLAKSERRRAEVEQERDMARSALVHERSAAGRHRNHASGEEVPLIERLAAMFA